MFSEELQTKLLEGVQALSVALNEQHLAAKQHATAEHAYRQKRAVTYIEFSADGEKRTVDLLKAMVDRWCDKEMFAVRLAEAEHEALTERVRSLRTEISALQSVLNAYKAEAEALRYGQTVGA